MLMKLCFKRQTSFGVDPIWKSVEQVWRLGLIYLMLCPVHMLLKCLTDMTWQAASHRRKEHHMHGHKHPYKETHSCIATVTCNLCHVKCLRATKKRMRQRKQRRQIHFLRSESNSCFPSSWQIYYFCFYNRETPKGNQQCWKEGLPQTTTMDRGLPLWSTTVTKMVKYLL